MHINAPARLCKLCGVVERVKKIMTLEKYCTESGYPALLFTTLVVIQIAYCIVSIKYKELGYILMIWVIFSMAARFHFSKITSEEGIQRPSN